MEFFIPSLFIFLIAAVVSFAILPRFSPIIISLLAIALLIFGIYHHYKMFKDEYKLSTWQQSLKLYAPAIMIGGILLFIIYAILSFFSGPSVPMPSINLPTVPELPEIKNIPSAATETVVDFKNNVTNALSNTAKRIKNMTENITANNKSNNTKTNGNNANNKANKGENLSRSFLEVL
jgi:hypothetical protein